MDTTRKACVTTCLAAALLALTLTSPGLAASINEATQAAELMRKGDMQGALPLYERLVNAEPTNALYAENLAVCLMAKLQFMPAGEERSATIQRARLEVSRARILGSNSNMLKLIQKQLDDPAILNPTEEDPRLVAAEKAFSRGDYDAALSGYIAIAESDPTSYTARLFAGDVHFARGDTRAAGDWFQKAIDVNPDLETAWRYWGDALAKSGDESGSLRYYISAVVAEPYSGKSWMGLQQWAKRNGAKLKQPYIPVPKVTSGASKENSKTAFNIAIRPELMADKASGAAWILYGSTRVAWMSGRFLEMNPGATYRHSLAEEIAALRSVLALTEQEHWTPDSAPETLRDLLRLEQAGLLEPYVLLNAADEGIAQDYEGYRQAHRDVLTRYIDQILIQRGATID